MFVSLPEFPRIFSQQAADIFRKVRIEEIVAHPYAGAREKMDCRGGTAVSRRDADRLHPDRSQPVP